MKYKYQFNSLSDVVHSTEYSDYEGENLDLQHNILAGKTDPEIVTHGDCIDCMRDYLDNVLVGKISLKREAKIRRDIQKLEKRHLDAGTYDDVVYDYKGDN